MEILVSNNGSKIIKLIQKITYIVKIINGL